MLTHIVALLLHTHKKKKKKKKKTESISPMNQVLEVLVNLLAMATGTWSIHNTAWSISDTKESKNIGSETEEAIDNEATMSEFLPMKSANSGETLLEEAKSL